MAVHEDADEPEEGAAGVSSVIGGCCRDSFSITCASAAPRAAAERLAAAVVCSTKSEDPELFPRGAAGYSQHGNIRCPDGA